MPVTRVVASAPCRADLAGGTLDIWPLGLLEEGALTVNLAVPVRVRLEADLAAPAGEVWHAVGDGPWRHLRRDERRHDLTAAVGFWARAGGGLRVRVRTQPPVGSGLGGSSAYAVAVARAALALERRRLAGPRLVAALRDLEAIVLGTATGSQDHWAALLGGALALHPGPGGDRVERLAVDPTWLAERMTLVYSGVTHRSGMVNWEVVRRRLDGDPGTCEALAAIAAAAARCREALLDADQTAVAAAVGDEWRARRRLAPAVCPPELAALEQRLLAAGASAFKACGAGGGGSVLLWHAPGRRPAVVAALHGTRAWAFAPGAAVGGCRVRRARSRSEIG